MGERTREFGDRLGKQAKIILNFVGESGKMTTNN
jgi:hypothetical protein